MWPCSSRALHCAAQQLAAQTGDPADALLRVQARLDPLLRPFGVVPFAQLTVLMLYLLEILVRYTEDSQLDVPAGRRWVEALASHLVAVTDEVVASPAGV